MSKSTLPHMIEAVDVNTLIQENQNISKDIRIIDLTQASCFLQQHVPGAVYLDYSWIVKVDPPRMGLLPEMATLENIFNAYGITNRTHVIAYDDEGGGRAGRLLWTLASCGHNNYSMINGGIQAWLGDQLPTTNEIIWPIATSGFSANINQTVIADKTFIQSNLDNEQVAILDTRSPMEYNGTKVFAQRGGHIPGAVNYEWTQAMDKTNHLRLKPQQQILDELATHGITQDKTIVVHCQTHHRSAYTFVMLQALGFENVRGYAGSWSDWGNDASMPVE